MNAIDRIVHDAIGSWCTGAVARVEHRGSLRYEGAFGSTRDDVGAKPVFVDTRFDLASITKLFVATLALRAVDDGLLRLDAPLCEIVSEWRNNEHRSITLRMLLSHTAGLNSGADYRELLGSNVAQFSLERDLVAKPGERVVYSDLGFIAVGVLLERVYRRSLGALIADFHRTSLGFAPRRHERPWIPATENDGWRGRVQGYVHDEKAYLMGGVAGHAGLFGTAADVAWLAREYLARSSTTTERCVSAHLVAEAVSEQACDPVLRRGLGWALKTSDDNSCGAAFSAESFGHTGFVGTCVWAEPKRELIGVLLTNAVYYGRRDTRELRAAFYDACVAMVDR